jgi:hypothetical protein
MRACPARQVRLQGNAITDTNTPTLCRRCADRLDDADWLVARNHRIRAETARYGTTVELVNIAAAQTTGLDPQQAFVRPYEGNLEFLHLEPLIGTLNHGVSLQAAPVLFCSLTILL